MLLPTLTIAAVIDSINPCAISVLLLTVGFLFSLNKDRNHILKIGLVYVAAIYVVYVSIGLGILQALTLFGIPRIFGKFGAIFIILAGAINIINYYFPKFPEAQNSRQCSSTVGSVYSESHCSFSYHLGNFGWALRISLYRRAISYDSWLIAR